MKKINCFSSALLGILLVAVSCYPEETLPSVSVTTVPVEEIYYNPSTDKTEVKIYGEMEGDVSAVIERGFIWSKEDRFATTATLVKDGQPFCLSMDDLEKAKTYFVKAYVKTKHSYFYGEYLSFSSATKPEVQSNMTIQDDVKGNYVRAKGHIISNGGAELSGYGAIIESASGVKTECAASNLDEEGNYSVNIGSLTQETAYQVSFFAENVMGRTVSDPIPLTTIKIVTPNAELNPEEPFSTIRPKKVIVDAQLLTDGNDGTTRYGVKWGLAENALTNTALSETISSDGKYSVEIADLEKITSYYFAGYAANESGEFIGKIYHVQTTNDAPATVETNSVKEKVDFLESTATLRGKMIDNGGRDITGYGFYFGTDKDNLTRKASDNMDGTGVFSISFNDLQPLTKYYYRAYVENRSEDTGEIEESLNIEILSFKTGILDKYVFNRNAFMEFTDEILLYNSLEPIEAVVDGKTVMLEFLDRNIGASEIASGTLTQHQFNQIGYYYTWGSQAPQVSSEMASLIKLPYVASPQPTLPKKDNVLFNGWNKQPFYNVFDVKSWNELAGQEKADNPCPKGFRIPKRSEYMAAFLAAKTSTPAQVAETFKIPCSGCYGPNSNYVTPDRIILWCDEATAADAACNISSAGLTATTGANYADKKQRAYPVRCIRDY